MANKGIGKIIGYGIAGILTIGGTTVVITHDDIAKQYKYNTGKELIIENIKLMNLEDVIEEEKGAKEVFENFYKIWCEDNIPEHYDSCRNIYNEIKALEKTIVCDENLLNNDNLEKSDITFCISAAKEGRDAIKDLNMGIYGYCNDICQEHIDGYEYEIARFETFLNKLD